MYFPMAIVAKMVTRLSEICGINIERYSFFEAEKGKTSLDSHFATFKFELKGWMKKRK